MIHSLSMENVGPAPRMEMEFGTRLNLITGDNGLGKSFLLDTIWWALTRKWPHEINSNLTSGFKARPSDPTQPATIQFKLESKTKPVTYQSQYVARDQAWTGKAGRPHNPGLVIYAQADGGFSVWDPLRNYWKTRGKIDSQDCLPGFVFAARDVWDGLDMTTREGKPVRVCKGMIDDWGGWIAAKSDESRRMNSVLKSLSPSSDAGDRLVAESTKRISTNDPRDIPAVRIGTGPEVPILFSSAGIKRVAQLAYMLTWTWAEHRRAAELLGEERTRQVIFLIDEIECHLHPRWQRTILNSLIKMIQIIHKSAQIQLISSTHSPLVMASAEPHFDSKQDAWFDMDLDRESGLVELRNRPFIRMGDASNWLMSEAFDLPQAISPEAESAILAALELFRESNPHGQRIQEVDKDLRATLGELDPFWDKWSRFRNSRLATA